MGRWDNPNQIISMPKSKFRLMLFAIGLAGGLVVSGITELAYGYGIIHC